MDGDGAALVDEAQRHVELEVEADEYPAALHGAAIDTTNAAPYRHGSTTALGSIGIADGHNYNYGLYSRHRAWLYRP